jgi:ribose-phosphate pyrophosphokinase
MPDLRIFPDGESKIKIPKVSGTCVIVQSTYPPTDTHLLQTLMMARKCSDDGISRVCAIIPYLAYARQDRSFLEGEFPTISLVARLFEAAGIEAVVTVDMHSQLGMSYFSPLDIVNVSSIPLLAEHARSMRLSNPIAVSPDSGGGERVKEFARILKTDSLVLKKSRNRTTGEVSIENTDMDLGGRDVVIVDDMISSGGSIIKAAQMLRTRKANKVYAMCAHALLLGNALAELVASGVDDIIATNSIPNKFAKVDLSTSLAEVLISRYHLK